MTRVPRHPLPSLRRSLGIVALLALAGCAGSGPPPADTTSSFDTIQQTIFGVHCLNSGCHNSTDRAGNLVLEAGLSHASLLDGATFNTVAAAAGLRRVDPGNPDLSFLIIKLNGPGPGEGTRMPQGLSALSAADVDSIRAWILAGAPDSSVPTATVSATASASVTNTPPATATRTATPTMTPTPTITPTGTQPSTPTPTITPTHTLPPTATASATATASPSPMPTPTYNLASTLPQIQTTIFNTTCLDVGCHNARDQGGGQVLEADVAYSQLVGVVPVNLAAQQMGLLRVDPGKPENSFLMTKLELASVFDPQFGSRMPLSKPPLSGDQIEQIRAWILRGALPDESPP